MFCPRIVRLVGCLALATVCATLGLMFGDTDAQLRAEDDAQKADAPVVYRGARIYTAAGPVIEHGVLVIHQGKISAVGPEADIKLPAGAVVRDLTGKSIIPGLVDTHSHIGIFSRPQVPAHQDGNEMTGPVQPGLRALDAINPNDPGIRMAVAGGVTTANIMPGSRRMPARSNQPRSRPPSTSSTKPSKPAWTKKSPSSSPPTEPTTSRRHCAWPRSSILSRS